MQSRQFRVDPRMVPPVVVAMCAGLVLLMLEGMTQRGMLLTLILSPFYYLGAEILARTVVIDDEAITIQKFLRSARLLWDRIESVDAVKTGNKLFLILQEEQGRPVFVTNTLKHFGELSEAVLAQVPANRISPGVHDMLANPPSKPGPMVQAWIVCLVLTGMVVGRLLGYG